MGDTHIKNVSRPIIEQIKGNYHVGDIKTVNNYGGQKKNKAYFESVTTGPDVFRDYPRPHFTEELFSKVKSEQLLLLGGNNGFNKGMLLKYVAVHLKTEGLEVKECTEFDSFYSISTVIQEEVKKSIFIIYNLTAREINYRFRDLKAVVQKKEHIVLCSTEDPYESWLLQEGKEDPCWFQIPDHDIYSTATLKAYLDTSLKKKNVLLSVDPDKIVGRLSNIEQLDIFTDLLSRSDNRGGHIDVEDLVAKSLKESHSAIEPWFYSLSNFNKLIVIGLSLFDGAYESQVFEGFERLLQASWKYRNSDLRSIDYEDLMPLKTYFKTDGKIIQGKLENQRQKIIQLAWRTHKRYILAALPVLKEIIYESFDEDKLDWDLFTTYSHRIRIRHVLSETLSDIGLHSFEDVELPLILIAGQSNIDIQMVAASAISRWKRFSEDKLYEVLEIWQERTADAGTSVSNVRGAIALTLYYASTYDEMNHLSPRVKELLCKFLHNNDDAIILRVKFAVEYITARHPESMKDLLKNEFLQYNYYILPIANGLSNAYNNGLGSQVKQILTEWLRYCDGLAQVPGEQDVFTQRERILSAIIFALSSIDYNATGEKVISIGEALDILERLRKKYHNVDIRRFLLDAIVDLIEAMFHSTEQINIQVISNIDAEEREYIVRKFREKYLSQRQELKGGDYNTQFEGYRFDTWSKAFERPRTAIEELLGRWKKGSDDVLSQIALKAKLEFQRIEDIEKKLIEDFLKDRDKDEKEKERKKKEYERKGEPIHEGRIRTTVETEAFVKMCLPFVSRDQIQLLNNMAPLAMQEDLKGAEAERFFAELDEQASRSVKNVSFIYALFRKGSFRSGDNPVVSSFSSTAFFILTFWNVPSQNRKLLRAFAPLLMSTPGLTGGERGVVINKIKEFKNNWIKIAYALCKNPVLLLIAIFICLVILYKILHLWS